MKQLHLWPFPMAVIVAVLTLPVRADSTGWPQGVLCDDTFLIATLDLDTAKPADLLDLFKVATGDHLGDLKEAAEKYKPLHARYAGTGLLSVSLIYRGDPGKRDEPTVQWCLRLSPGAGHAAVIEELKADFAEFLDAWDIVNEADFILMRPKGASGFLGHHEEQAVELPPACKDAAEDQRQVRHCAAGQRAVRGRGRRDRAAEPDEAVRCSHAPSAPHGHLLCPRR